MGLRAVCQSRVRPSMLRLFKKLKASRSRHDADSGAEPSYLYSVKLQDEPNWEELTEAAHRRMRRRALVESIGNVTLGFLLAIPLFIVRSVKKRSPTPTAELDEHGFPMDWRQDPSTRTVLVNRLEKSSGDWEVFERWCEARSFKSFAASPETVLKFLTDPPVHGARLAAAYQAIDYMHDAHYWNEDANPCYYVKFAYGVEVAPDGTVTFADHWRIFDWWCRGRDAIPLPASPTTALAFLRDAPLSGHNLYRVWTAVGERHDAYYRHEDANPCHVLERDFGARVSPDGVATIPHTRETPSYRTRWDR